MNGLVPSKCGNNKPVCSFGELTNCVLVETELFIKFWNRKCVDLIFELFSLKEG